MSDLGIILCGLIIAAIVFTDWFAARLDAIDDARDQDAHGDCWPVIPPTRPHGDA